MSETANILLALGFVAVGFVFGIYTGARSVQRIYDEILEEQRELIAKLESKLKNNNCKKGFMIINSQEDENDG